MSVCRRGLACLLGAFAAGLLTPVADAHDLGISRVSITQTGTHSYHIEAKLPPGEPPPPPVFPERFDVSDGLPPTAPAYYSWTAESRSTPLAGSDQLLLPWARDGAFVSAVWLDGSSGGHFFPFSDRGTTVGLAGLGGGAPPLWDTALRYGRLGVEHILSGWDHLAFVLALFLLVQGWGLIRLVTAFTLGHSVTLVAAFVGWVHVPSPPVEAAIALSIILVAAQALSKQRTLNHGFGIVFGFGLLHGLGFAGALSEAGIPKSELVAGLFSFNIGVEIGQLMFIAAALGVAAVARSAFDHLQRPFPSAFRYATAIALVAIGTFWTISRIASFTA